MIKSVRLPERDQVIKFLWQHVLLLISFFIMTLGVALCVRSSLGSSAISALPMAFSIAGEEGLAPALSIGGYTNIMNIILVFAQIVVLRRRFERVQLFQLVIGFLFGALIDLNMSLTAVFDYSSLTAQTAAQLIGCSVMGFGIAMEVRCGSVTMPGEGIQVAISRVSGIPFGKVKIIIDCTLVCLTVLSCYLFWGAWQWNIIGPGTLFAMVYVGWLVRLISRHMEWFDRLLGNGPSFAYGLARYLRRRN